VTAADQCDLLGLQRTGNPDVVRGFFWMEDLCVEDSGTCPFVYGKLPTTSHTPEYVLATSMMWVTLILWLASFGVFYLRYSAYKRRKAKEESRGKIFKLNDL
jgi:cbb3-type cytochrome oxidase subunit 3